VTSFKFADLATSQLAWSHGPCMHF